MENEKKRNVNWEKIGVYFAGVGFMVLLIQSQFSLVEKISDLKERIAKLEVKIEYMEKEYGRLQRN